MAVDFDTLVNRVLVSPAVFGETQPVVFSPVRSDPGGAPYTVDAIFDRAHEIVLDEIAKSEMKGAGVSTTAPVLSVRLASFSAKPKQKDVFEIGTERFTVIDVQSDGRGMADIVLREID